MKKRSWLRWRREEQASVPSQDIKAVRRRTDQKIKQQNAQERLQDDKAQKQERGQGRKKS